MTVTVIGIASGIRTVDGEIRVTTGIGIVIAIVAAEVVATTGTASVSANETETPKETVGAASGIESESARRGTPDMSAGESEGTTLLQKRIAILTRREDERTPRPSLTRGTTWKSRLRGQLP